MYAVWKTLNFCKIFQGDLSYKLLVEIGSKNIEDLDCNYNTASNVDNKRIYNSKHRSYVLVYKAIYTDYNASTSNIYNRILKKE